MLVTKMQNFKQLLSKAFPLIALLLTLILLIAGSFEFIPAWILRDPVDDIHLWHIAELAALAAIFLGSMMFELSRRPEEKPLLAQFVILSVVILAAGILPFEIRAGGLFLIGILFVVAYPRTRSLLSFSREGSISYALLGLSLLIAVFLVPRALREIQWQAIGMTNDVHALQLHWIGSALLMLLLVLAGVLASTKRPGWMQLGIITGTTYCYLGLIAMLVPDYAGSWGYTGGFFSIFAGLFYILITLTEAQSMNNSRLAAETVSKDEPLNTENTHNFTEKDETLIASAAQQ